MEFPESVNDLLKADESKQVVDAAVKEIIEDLNELAPRLKMLIVIYETDDGKRIYRCPEEMDTSLLVGHLHSAAISAVLDSKQAGEG